MENINYELIGSLFMAIMFTKFAWDLQGWFSKWLERWEKTRG